MAYRLSSGLRQVFRRLPIRCSQNVLQPTTPFSSEIALELPPNLTMPEGLGVFKPDPAPVIPPMEMLFPPLSIDTTMPVLNFLHPGQYSSQDMQLNPQIFGVAIRYGL